MLIYFIIALFLFILAVRYDCNSKTSGKKRWEITATIVLILFAGLRYHVGSDTLVYEELFYDSLDLKNYFNGFNWLEEREPLWQLLNSIILYVFQDFIAFQIVIAILFHSLLYIFLKKTTRYIFTSYLIIFCAFWWNFNFEIMRESICVVLFLYSLLLIHDKKWMYAFFICLSLLFIHRFSFLIIIISMVVLFTPKKIVYPALIGISILLLVFADSSLITSIVLYSSDYSNTSAADKMMRYLESDVEGFHTFNIVGLIETLTLSMSFPILIIIDRNKTNDTKTKLLLKFLPLVIMFAILKLKMSILGRIVNYYEIILVVQAVNTLYDNTFNSTIKKIFSMLVILYALQGCYYFYKPTYYSQANATYDERYIPYTSIFSDNKHINGR